MWDGSQSTCFIGMCWGWVNEYTNTQRHRDTHTGTHTDTYTQTYTKTYRHIDRHTCRYTHTDTHAQNRPWHKLNTEEKHSFLPFLPSFLPSFLLFDSIIFHSPGWPGSYYAIQTGTKVASLSHLGDYRYESPCPAEERLLFLATFERERERMCVKVCVWERDR